MWLKNDFISLRGERGRKCTDCWNRFHSPLCPILMKGNDYRVKSCIPYFSQGVCCIVQLCSGKHTILVQIRRKQYTQTPTHFLTS